MVIHFEKSKGEEQAGDQKWFVELPRARAGQLKI